MVNPSENPSAEFHERDREIADLQAKLNATEKRLKEVEANLAKAKKNSRNSSKSPSSDFDNAQKKQKRRDKAKKWKIGGQPGHPRHERTAFSEEQVDHHWEWRYEAWPCCGGSLEDTGEPRVQQHVELPTVPVNIDQHDFETVRGARRRSVVNSVLESIRCYVSRFTLFSVVTEITSWQTLGKSCFAWQLAILHSPPKAHDNAADSPSAWETLLPILAE